MTSSYFGSTVTKLTGRKDSRLFSPVSSLAATWVTKLLAGMVSFIVHPGQTLFQLELPLLVAGLDSVLHDPPIASCVL